MKSNVTRRDLLTLGGGVAVGSMLTPAPWLLIDDLAIWTQNWKWIPVPPKGERTSQTTVCSLCPAGCAVEARCVGGLPIALKAAAGGAALCPLGMTGHHLPWHPGLLKASVRVARRDGTARLTAVPRESIVREVADGLPGSQGRGTVAVLDLRPGRSMTWAWRNLLAGIAGAVVIPAPGRDGASLSAMTAFAPEARGEWAADLENATAILSFGAPLGEGWGGVRTRSRFLERTGVPLIQVEPRRSSTAAVADLWIPARPRTEGAVALGIAFALCQANREIDRRAGELRPLLGRFTPSRAAALAGIRTEVIVEAASMLLESPRPIVIAGEDFAGGRYDRPTELAILALNVLLGGVGVMGGVIAREPLPDPIEGARLAPFRELDEAADASIGLLIVDGSAGDAPFPWPEVARKLVKGALVVGLSPFAAGCSLHADRIIPTATFLEAVHEVPGACDSAGAEVAIARPLVPRQMAAVDPASLVREIANLAGIELAGTWSSMAELIEARVVRIHEKGEGIVLAAGVRREVKDFGSASELHGSLLEGARWIGEPTSHVVAASIPDGMAEELEALVSSAPSREDLVVVPRMPRDAALSAALSPLFTKLHQESGLLREAGVAFVNPATARAKRLRPGRKSIIATRRGRFTARIETDHAVMPGVVELAVGPTSLALGQSDNRVISNPLDVCGSSESPGWRYTPATIEEA